MFSNNNLPKGIDFDDCSKEVPVARVKVINKDSIEFQWLGFFNKKTKKREMTKKPFTNNEENGSIILEKCK